MRKSRLSSLIAAVAVVAGLAYVISDDNSSTAPPPVAAAEQSPHLEVHAPADPVGYSAGDGMLGEIIDNLAGSLGSSEQGGAPAGDGSVDVAATRAQLDALEVKGRAPKTGYSRSEFGRAWSDDAGVELSGNGCDTRSDILLRDLLDVVMRDECIVESGTLHGPYTAKMIAYKRDRTPDVDIDHVVALSDSWQKGAQQWDAARRLAFANDPRNLLAVDASANRQKGDGDAATWLPPHKPYRCTYVSKQVDVKTIYGLWITQAEKDAIDRVLDAC